MRLTTHPVNLSGWKGILMIIPIEIIKIQRYILAKRMWKMTGKYECCSIFWGVARSQAGRKPVAAGQIPMMAPHSGNERWPLDIHYTWSLHTIDGGDFPARHVWYVWWHRRVWRYDTRRTHQPRAENSENSHCSLLSCSSISDCWDLAPWQSWRHGVFYKHQDNYIGLKSNYRLG